MTATMKTGQCPRCGDHVEWERLMIDGVELLATVVPLCDRCGEHSAANREAAKQESAWRNLYRTRLPEALQVSEPARVDMWYRTALDWNPAEARHYGGIGLVGTAGAGKSSTIACLLWSLRRQFRWMNGAAARKAALDATTADVDRDGARRRWDAAMTEPILVLDDISQAVFTPTWTASLFDLLDTRINSRLPTFWTSQISVPRIEQKIMDQSKDVEAAEAIGRRLAQHSLLLSDGADRQK